MGEGAEGVASDQAEAPARKRAAVVANYCSHCGGKFVGSEDRCLQCGTKRPARGGWLARLLGRLFGGSGRRPGSTVFRSDEEIALAPGAELWLDKPSAGVSLRWESTDGHLPDDLPEEMRIRLQALRRSAAERGEGFEIRTSKTELYIVKDKSGRERRYKSLDEMPPEVRREIEKSMRDRHDDHEPNPEWPL